MTFQIGNNPSRIEVIDNKGCRTEKQYKSFLSIKDIQYLCSNPFKFDGKVYNCTFRLHYVDKEGYLCSVDITPTGLKRRAWKSDSPLKA